MKNPARALSVLVMSIALPTLSCKFPANMESTSAASGKTPSNDYAVESNRDRDDSTFKSDFEEPSLSDEQSAFSVEMTEVDEDQDDLDDSYVDHDSDLEGEGVEGAFEKSHNDPIFDAEFVKSEIPADLVIDEARDKRSDDKPKVTQRIFASSRTFSGDLLSDFEDQRFHRGVNGADYRCQFLATKAGLEGQWKALVSDSRKNIKKRIRIKGQVVNMVGERVAKDKKSFWKHEHESSVDFDEYGKFLTEKLKVWTGLKRGGKTVESRNCDNWTTDSRHVRAKFGKLNSFDKRSWVTQRKRAARCSREHRLYCIEQK